MYADLKYVESLEKEIDERESDKVVFSNMYDVILQECVSKDVMCSYFQSLSDLDALAELQYMYLHKVKECDCLAQKLSNQTASAAPTQAWLWHQRLSHLNFDYINLLSKNDIVIGLPKLKYVKDQLCSSCELSKSKRSSFKSKVVPSFKGRLNLLYMDLCGPMRVASINGKKYILVIVDDYSRYTDGENLDKEKGVQCILVGYSTQLKGYRVYNKRTRMIAKSIHICFDEIKEVSETSVANNTSGLVPQRQKALDYDNPDPVPQRQDVYSSADADVPSQQELDILFGPLYDEFFNADYNHGSFGAFLSYEAKHRHVFASPVSDKGNIIRRKASFSFPLTRVEWLPLIANSFAVSGIVIAEPGVGATTWSAAHIDNSWVSKWIVSLVEWNSSVSSTKSSIQSTFRFR
nr:retrovirus-related Pol polyprotein from transposon TNT 1-94 [Tanacetum cinerariifolium]